MHIKFAKTVFSGLRQVYDPTPRQTARPQAWFPFFMFSCGVHVNTFWVHTKTLQCISLFDHCAKLYRPDAVLQCYFRKLSETCWLFMTTAFLHSCLRKRHVDVDQKSFNGQVCNKHIVLNSNEVKTTYVTMFDAFCPCARTQRKWAIRSWSECPNSDTLFKAKSPFRTLRCMDALIAAIIRSAKFRTAAS